MRFSPSHKKSSIIWNWLKKTPIVAVGVLVSLSFWNVGCKKEIDSPVIRTIGQTHLTQAELDFSTQYAKGEDRDVAESLYIEDWEKNAALYELAMQEGWQETNEALILIEKARRQIVVNRFLEEKLETAKNAGKFNTDSVEVKQYYETHQAEFVFKEPQYKLLRLYSAAKDSATKLMRLLYRRDGVKRATDRINTAAPTLTELNQNSIERSKRYIKGSKLHLENKTLRSLLKQMRAGTTSPVVKIHDSLFCVMYLDAMIEEGTAMSLENAYSQINDRLEFKKQSAFMDQLELKAREAVK